jgi:hypothetical protein
MMKTTKTYRIDPGRKKELHSRISELAASYAPEWIFDPNDPDIGSVIAMLFAEQMAGSVDRFGQVVEKYRTELVNLLNIGLLPAYPAEGVCVLYPLQETISGVDVPAGTKLFGDSPLSEETVVFETQTPLHVTNAQIRDIIEVSGAFGHIAILRGDVAEVHPMGVPAPAPSPDGGPNARDADIRLFDFTDGGIEKHALILYHENAFDVPSHTSVLLEAFSPDGAPLAEALAKEGAYRFRYYDGEGFADYDEVEAHDDAVALRRDGEAKKLSLPDGRLCDALRIDATGPVRENIEVGLLRIHSLSPGVPVDFVNNNDSDLPVGECMPFGDTASLFDDCYIGSDNIFSHSGAEITLRFSLGFREKLVTFTPQQEEESLKIIKRKPRRVLFTTAHTHVDRIAVEYFNGSGWRRLADNDRWASIFDGNTTGDIELTFVCPESWEQAGVGANTGRCLRLRIESAANCYLQPCIHHMPVISGLTVSYRYSDNKKTPFYAERINGADRTDLTHALIRGETVSAFEPIKYTDNALYLGFDRRIEGRPLSLYFGIRDKIGDRRPALRFEYSTLRGFSPMRVIDETYGLSKSGVIMMELGEDMARYEVEGRDRYWVRIVDVDGVFDDPDRLRPVITDILPNAVTVQNERTMEEEEYYIDESAPNMAFPLHTGNIMSAEVFVNETDLPRVAMQQMLERTPEDVRASYDRRGDINEFYVRWREVENFDASVAADRHYVIDRLHNAILFGDGVNVRIPAASPNPAFTVRLKRCDGAAGNLPSGGINSMMDRILYIGDIYNPLAASGGRDMESVRAAVERGAGILNSGGRLVSEADYVREAENFSDMIGRASCFIDRGGEEPADTRKVRIVLLMRDYATGSWSFDNISERLRSGILKKCEATLTPEHIEISEPLFVSIDIDVWVHSDDVKHRFEIAALIREKIAERIEPLPRTDEYGDRSGGWRIGDLPTLEQIDIMLHGIRVDATIRRFTATASYTDMSGEHVCELGGLDRKPFMVGVNGRHKVHFL